MAGIEAMEFIVMSAVWTGCNVLFWGLTFGKPGILLGGAIGIVTTQLYYKYG